MAMVKINKMTMLAEETEGKYITEHQGERYQNLFESVLRVLKDNLCRVNKFMNVSNSTLYVSTYALENGEMKWSVVLAGDVNYHAGQNKTENDVIDSFNLLLAQDALLKAVDNLVEAMEDLANSKVFCEVNAEITVEGINSDIFIPMVKLKSYTLA